MRLSALHPRKGSTDQSLLAATLSLTFGTAVLTWWAIGDQSIAGMDPNQLCYAVGPIHLPSVVEAVLAGVGAVLAVLSVLTFGWHAIHRRVDWRWWPALLMLQLFAAMAASGGRVVTAGVIGVNIGAGLIILFGGPIMLALLISASVLIEKIMVPRTQRPEDS